MKHVDLGTRVNRILAAGLIGASALGLSQKANAALYMNINEPQNPYESGSRPFNFSIENLAPNNPANYMISLSIPGFNNPSDIYGISLGNDFTGWTYLFNHELNGSYTLNLSLGSGSALETDGVNNGDPIGSLHFDSHYSGLQTVYAYAFGAGSGADPNLEFEPFQIEIPAVPEANSVWYAVLALGLAGFDAARRRMSKKEEPQKLQHTELPKYKL